MAFTYAAFVPAFLDMTVTGVVTYADEPPNQITTAELPLMFPRFPGGNNSVQAFNGGVGLTMATVELVIVIEPVRQNMQSVNFAAALALLDNLASALTTNALTIGVDSWEMRIEQDSIGDTGYWLLIATVDGSG